MSSDYVSMASIQLKNQLLTPHVLDLYRNDDLTLSNIQGTVAPQIEIYRNTYNYIQFPNISEAAKKLIMMPNSTATGIALNQNPAVRVEQTTPPVKSVNGVFYGPT